MAGVLLTAHGTVDVIEDMPAFVARIRHGRPAPPELVLDLQRRYREIGGSPLLAITRAQADALQQELGLPVFIGMRLWRPELREALGQALEQNVRRLCVLPLAPYSVPVYARAAERALAELGAPGLELVAVAPYGTSSGLIEAHARAIAPFLAGAGSDTTELILTAHSLPQSVIDGGDPYAELVSESARCIAHALGWPYQLAFQSQGADGGAWLGPDLKAVLAAARGRGRRRVVVAPVGFLCDHVETLYDLDIEARRWADDLSLEFARVPALNAAQPLIAALTTAVRDALSD